MTYAVHNLAGAQPIANNSTEQKHALGTVVRATSPTYGEGEFIYLLGVASTAVGSLVTYNATTYQTALAPIGTNLPQPVAVAMAATVASEYGWYQISGIAVTKKGDVSIDTGVAVGVATIGVVSATATGKEVQGALAASTAAASVSTINLVINRPHMQGRIT